jgi:hypothetical protein
MFIPSRNLLAVLLFLCVSSLFAQSVLAQEPQSPNQTQTVSEEQQSEPTAVPPQESGAPVPLPLNLDASSLRFSSESARSNYLEMGVQTGATYDDNLLSAATRPIGSFSYNVLPTIRLEESRRRLIWGLNYSGGYTANQRFSDYNQGSHKAGIDVKYRLSPHVKVRVSDSFLRTSVLFGQFQSDAAGGGTGVIQQPNQSVITPLSEQQNNLAAAEITYQFSAGDLVGATGTFSDTHFSHVAGSTELLNTSTQEADGFYTHRFAAHNWSGIAYKFQRLRFHPSIEETDTHSFLLFHTVYLQPRMALAFFAGPEYSQLNSQIVATSITLPFVSVVSDPAYRGTWTVAGGASFSWQGKLTSVQGSAARKVTDGGGLLSGVRATVAGGGVRRQLGRSSTVELSASYGDSRPLEQGSGSFSLVRSVSGSVGWEQKLGRSFSVQLGYARDYQQQNLAATSALDINHNRGWVTLGYQFTKALGR